MSAAVRARIGCFSAHIVCPLCRGYIIDATTIVECLHAFCKSCIVLHLQLCEYCPVCDVLAHKTRPLMSLRSDPLLQELIYRLVPGLYYEEMWRRRYFYTHVPRGLWPVDRAESSGHGTRLILTTNDPVSLCLRYIVENNDDDDDASISPALSPAPPDRFIRCNGSVSVAHLCRLLLCKLTPSAFSSSTLSGWRVHVATDRHALVVSDTMTLTELAYSRRWNRKQPLLLYYRLTCDVITSSSARHSDAIVQMHISETGQVEFKTDDVTHTSCVPHALLMTSLTPVLDQHHMSLITSPVSGDSLMTSSVSGDPMMTSSVGSDPLMTSSVCSDSLMTSSICSDPRMPSSICNDSLMTSYVSGDPLMTSSICSDPLMTSSVCNDPLITSSVSVDSPMTSSVSGNSPMTSSVCSDSLMTSHSFSNLVTSSQPVVSLMTSHCASLSNALVTASCVTAHNGNKGGKVGGNVKWCGNGADGKNHGAPPHTNSSGNKVCGKAGSGNNAGHKRAAITSGSSTGGKMRGGNRRRRSLPPVGYRTLKCPPRAWYQQLSRLFQPSSAVAPSVCAAPTLAGNSVLGTPCSSSSSSPLTFLPLLVKLEPAPILTAPAPTVSSLIYPHLYVTQPVAPSILPGQSLVPTSSAVAPPSPGVMSSLLSSVICSVLPPTSNTSAAISAAEIVTSV